jgi:hypothetical protein
VALRALPPGTSAIDTGKGAPMERDPGKTPDLEGDDLFGNPEKVDHSIEEDLDARLQDEQDEDDDN